MDLAAARSSSDNRPATAGRADRADPDGHLDATQLRRRTWWTTVGVCYCVGAFLLVSVLATERSLPVAIAGALGSVVATVASGRLLERRLPGTARDAHGPTPVGLAALAALGAVAAIAAAQFASSPTGALVPGVATAGIAAHVPRRWWSRTVSAGAATSGVVVAAAQQAALGRPEPAAVANQVLLVVATAGALVVARWFWQLVHRLERSRRLEAELAVADERLRFAADLHDVQGHHLQVIALHSELAERLAASDPDAAALQMSRVHEQARTALADTRRVVQGYRRTPLADELGNATRVLEAAGVDGRLSPGTVDDARLVDDPGRQLLGLVVREATTNILRHSRALRARLELEVEGTHASLRISNDGAATPDGGHNGPDGPDDGPGTGLTGLSARVEDAGGRLRWEQRDGWFTLDARVPISAPGPA